MCKRHKVVRLRRVITYIREVSKWVMTFHVRVNIVTDITNRRQALRIRLPRLTREIHLANDVVDRYRTGEVTVVGYVLASRHQEIISDRRLRVGIVIRRQSVTVRERLEIRHCRTANRILIPLILEDDNEHMIELRHR